MNRLAPLIVRRPRIAASAALPSGAGFAAAPLPAAPAASDDLKMFVTNFLGGLAFFGAYLA